MTSRTSSPHHINIHRGFRSHFADAVYEQFHQAKLAPRASQQTEREGGRRRCSFCTSLGVNFSLPSLSLRFIKASLFLEKSICQRLIDDAGVQSGLSEHYKLFRVLLLALTFILLYSHLRSCNNYNALGNGVAPLSMLGVGMFAMRTPRETDANQQACHGLV